MNKGLLLLTALSGSMFAQDTQNADITANATPEAYVLPIKDMDGYRWEDQGYLTKDPTSPNRALLVIQENENQKRCMRFINHVEHTTRMLPIESLPVQEATRAIIAKKLQKTPQDWVSCSDCHTDTYDNFARNNLANSMRARSGNKQDIEKAQAGSNIINEVPIQRIHNDAREAALQELKSYEAHLNHHEFPQAEQVRLLSAYHKRLERWQKAPSKDVIYSDNYHDQSEKED